jgi:hypothetical protein
MAERRRKREKLGLEGKKSVEVDGGGEEEVFLFSASEAHTSEGFLSRVYLISHYVSFRCRL